MGLFQPIFPPSLPKRSMQRSCSDKTKDGSRPAHTEQILPLDQRKQLHHCCRRSIVLAAVVTKRGFRIAFHAPPVLLRGFALPELEGEKRGSCSRRLAMFAASLNFSLDRCKTKQMMCLVIISIMTSFVFCKLS